MCVCIPQKLFTSNKTNDNILMDSNKFKINGYISTPKLLESQWKPAGNGVIS